MHFPISFSLLNHTIPLHAFTEIAAYFIGYRYFSHLRKRYGDPISLDHRRWITVVTIFGAIIGSRIVGAFENPSALFSSKNIWWYAYSNKSVLGGFVGGLFIVEAFKKIIKEKHSSGDLITFPIILALIIGRIGCFSMGVYEETYGTETHFFTGINLGDGLLRHPVSLYEIGFLISVWILLARLEKKQSLLGGSRFKIFLISYFIYRFVQEFIKPSPPVFLNLSTIQIVSIIGLFYYFREILQPKKLLA